MHILFNLIFEKLDFRHQILQDIPVLNTSLTLEVYDDIFLYLCRLKIHYKYNLK